MKICVVVYIVGTKLVSVVLETSVIVNESVEIKDKSLIMVSVVVSVI